MAEIWYFWDLQITVDANGVVDGERGTPFLQIFFLGEGIPLNNVRARGAATLQRFHK